MYHDEGYRVYTFEPKTDLYASLKSKTEHLCGYTIINKAVCLEDGEAIFNICRSGGASSLLMFKDDKELEEHWTDSRTDIQFSGESYKVRTTRLDTFLEENGLTNVDIDYLHCDAQGVDLDVLKSLGKYICNLKQGVIESAFSNEKTIYRDQNNTVNSAIKWLTENGFEIVNIISNDWTNCECNIKFTRRNV